MIVEPSITDLLKLVDDRYELIIVSSKRARQIAEGATVLVILSVILTLIGGLIPSRQAAKKDPVLALRSE